MTFTQTISRSVSAAWVEGRLPAIPRVRWDMEIDFRPFLEWLWNLVRSRQFIKGAVLALPLLMAGYFALEVKKEWYEAWGSTILSNARPFRVNDLQGTQVRIADLETLGLAMTQVLTAQVPSERKYAWQELKATLPVFSNCMKEDARCRLLRDKLAVQARVMSEVPSDRTMREFMVLWLESIQPLMRNPDDVDGMKQDVAAFTRTLGRAVEIDLL